MCNARILFKPLPFYIVQKHDHEFMTSEFYNPSYFIGPPLHAGGFCDRSRGDFRRRGRSHTDETAAAEQRGKNDREK